MAKGGNIVKGKKDLIADSRQKDAKASKKAAQKKKVKSKK